MKILITSIVDLRKSQHNRPHQFVKYLSKRHEVTVLSINDWWKGGQDDLSSYSGEFKDVFKRVEFVYMTDKRISPILQEVLLSRKVGEVLKEDFDVHLNYSTLISGYLAARNIRTVYDIADDLSAMIRASPQIPSFLRLFGGMFGDIMMRKNIKIAERITITTDLLRESCNIPDEKCEVVPNGVDTSLFKNYGDTKEELGLDGFILGYVGVLREWVDLKPVFLALRNLDSDVKLMVVGKEGRFDENVRLARKCGVYDRVIFTGMIPHYQVPRYISAMDICLIPFKKCSISKSALPLKLFEYMACEKPVISADLPGVRGTIGSGVMYAQDDREYVEGIMELYGNAGMRYDLGKAGRQFVEENRDWVGIVSRMEEILMETT